MQSTSRSIAWWLYYGPLKYSHYTILQSLLFSDNLFIRSRFRITPPSTDGVWKLFRWVCGFDQGHVEKQPMIDHHKISILSELTSTANGWLFWSFTSHHRWFVFSMPQTCKCNNCIFYFLTKHFIFWSTDRATFLLKRLTKFSISKFFIAFSRSFYKG